MGWNFVWRETADVKLTTEMMLIPECPTQTSEMTVVLLHESVRVLDAQIKYQWNPGSRNEPWTNLVMFCKQKVLIQSAWIIS